MSWQDCKIVGANTDPDVYKRDDKTRGDKDFAMSRGALMAFLECPSKWVAGVDTEPTPATEWGSLIDCMILTPNEFEKRYLIVEPEYLRIDGGWKPKQQEQWRKDHPGCEPIKEKKLEEPRAALARFKQDQRAMALLTCSETQVMVIGTWNQGGVLIPCKGLIDIAPKPSAPPMFASALADLKTGRTANPIAWRKEVYKHSYHVQAAFYLDMYNAATGEKRDSFLNVIQESTKPYEIGRRFLSAEYIQLGRATYQGAFTLYADCLKSNTWPSYDDMAKTTIEGWASCEPEPWMMLQEIQGADKIDPI